MKDLNHVQNALEEKAKDEIKKIVTNFMRDVNSMSERYGRPLEFHFHLNLNKKCYCTIDEFERVITQSLVDRHLKYIVRHKTEELLRKIELI